MKIGLLLARRIATVSAACILAIAPAQAERTLTPHNATYKVKISVVSGELNTQLEVTDSGYSARHVIKPVGMSKLLTRGTMDVTSEFVAEDGVVKPVRFKSVDTIREDPDVALTFDWQRNEASGTVGDEAVLFSLDGLSHDNVSIQYALMHDLMHEGPSTQYTLFDIDKMRVANVTKAGRKTIRTKAGKFEAIGIRHQKEGSSRITTMWCVEELDFLPVIIEQHRKGKLKFRATLIRYAPQATQTESTAATAAASMQ